MDEKKFKLNVRERGSKEKEEGAGEESRFFHEMLIVTFANQPKKFETLKAFYKKMTGSEREELWVSLERKLSMLVEELHCFIEISGDLRNLENLAKKTKSELKTVKEKRLKLNESNVAKVGFFKPVTKEEKLEGYRKEIERLEGRLEVLKSLLGILGKVVVEKEIGLVKQRKKERFEGAIQQFAYRQMKILEDSLGFWQGVAEDKLFSESKDNQQEDKEEEIKEEVEEEEQQIKEEEEIITE